MERNGHLIGRGGGEARWVARYGTDTRTAFPKKMEVFD